MTSISDCGCWAGAGGLWHLSPECLAEEREKWKRAIDLSHVIAEEIRQGDYSSLKSSRDTAHERAVLYFRQELRDHVE